MDRAILDRYENGAEKLKLAIRGLTAEDMRQCPVPNTWSIHQIVIHLADSDLIGSDRMKRVIAEENPTLIGFDESKFSKTLHYHEQSVEDALTLFDLNRKQTARVLRRLPDAAFDRKGTHSERGPMSLAQLVAGFCDHLDHHLKFIADKREMMGKSMW